MRDEIIKAIKEKSPKSFISEYIYDRIPYIFNEDREAFIIWRQQLGDAINVDPYSILIVGSATIGVSLNPYKSFRPFDEDSDVDLAIVSNYHFTLSWRFLRNNNYLRTHLDERSRIAWDDHKTRLIYWGTIATDKLLGRLPFGAQWIEAKNKMCRMPHTFGRTISFRIYSDYESLRAYQIMSLTTAKAILLK